MNNSWSYLFQVAMKNGIAGNCCFFKKNCSLINGRYRPFKSATAELLIPSWCCIRVCMQKFISSPDSLKKGFMKFNKLKSELLRQGRFCVFYCTD